MFFTALSAIESDYEREFLTNLYKKYYTASKIRALSITGDENEAEEVVQEAFIKLIEHVSSIMHLNKSVLFVYTLTTVKNTAIDHLRKRNKEADRCLAFEDIADPKSFVDINPLPEDLYLQDERLRELSKMLEVLPNKYKLILESKYILEETDKEIALRLGISEHSVRTYLTRARRQAFNLMEEGSFDETSKAQRKAALEQSR